MVATLVRRTAKELAGAFYDGQDMLKDNRTTRTEKFRQLYPEADDFVREQWTAFVPAARVILAEMLKDPGRSDREKNSIFDALLRDHGLKTDEYMVDQSIIRPN